MSIETRFAEDVPEASVSGDLSTREGLREFMHTEFQHFLTDVEFRVKQAYDVERRDSVMSGGKVYAEDLDLLMHQMTGYTMTANTPTVGSIAWTAVHVVYGGVDYTITDGNTANRYAWFIKPGSGTTATLQTSNVKPALGPNDCLVFVNQAGTPINALTASIPVALADGAVDTGSIANGAVTAAKTDFYSTLTAALTNAQTDASNALALADGSITTHIQGTAPWANGTVQESARTSDLWLDDDGLAYRWSGPAGTPPNTWKLIPDNGVAKAILDAANAQDLAEGKITTFYANLAAVPVALAPGDLWIVGDQGNQLRRATAAGGGIGNWPVLQISGVAIAPGGVGATQLGPNAVTPTKLNILQHVIF